MNNFTIYNDTNELALIDNITPNTLINTDCLQAMQKIPNSSIDMILCDLPYQMTACKWDTIIPMNDYLIYNNKVYTEQDLFDLSIDSDNSSLYTLHWFKKEKQLGLWSHYNRIIKDNGAIVLFSSQPFTSYLINSNLSMFKYEWIWEKSKCSNFLLVKKQPMKAHENILVFSKKATAYNPQMTVGKPFSGKKRAGKHGSITEVYKDVPNPTYRNDNEGTRYPRTVQYFKTAETEGKLHPTQKPIALCEYLIKTYTNEEDTVLDNCMGSGTTGVACINTNRKFIGIEKDNDYFNVAKNRIIV
jgi:site-specific DNA-methyltransferase (adenine-specific)